MKLSIEAKVVAAVAAAFMALTVGAVAQGHSKAQTSGPNNFGPTNSSAVVSDENGRQQREARHDAREQRQDRQQARRQRHQRHQKTNTNNNSTPSS